MNQFCMKLRYTCTDKKNMKHNIDLPDDIDIRCKGKLAEACKLSEMP